MKKALIGIILLAIGIWLATSAGRQMAGGTGTTVPLGTVEIKYQVNGK